jgi:hypothetical protein
MPINHDEIIEEIEAHIRKFGGGFGEWCVGTAKDSRGPFFRRHLAADLGDGLAYREAFTTTAAQAVVDHLLNDRGLEFDRDALPEPGKIVFAYRKGEMVSGGNGEGEMVSGTILLWGKKGIVFGYGQSEASGCWRDDLSCAEPRELPLSAVPRNCAL